MSFAGHKVKSYFSKYRRNDEEKAEELKNGLPGVSQRLRRSSKEFRSLYSKFERGVEEATRTESVKIPEFSYIIFVGKTYTLPGPAFSTLGEGGRHKLKESKLVMLNYI